jgi:ribose transport system substrate-binding protein
MKAAKFIVLGLLAVLCVAIVAGCGSSDSSTSATTGGSTEAETETPSGEEAATTASDEEEGAEGGSGFDLAKEKVAFYEEERSGPEIPKLSEPAPKGKTIAIATCPIPACQQTTDGAKQAAKELGWKVSFKTYELTPESFQKTMAEIADEAPDAFTFVDAFPSETIEASLKKMSEGGTAIVEIAPQAGEKPSELVPSVLQGAPFYELGGEVAAFKILADAEKATNTAVVYDPSYGVFKETLEGFEKTITANCPECSVKTLEVSLATPAPQVQSQVTNFLAQNSDLEYLFFPLSDQASALPESLEAAGLSEKVQFVTQTAGLPDLEHVSEGKQLATIQNENFSAGYAALDGALRIMIEGDPGIEEYPEGYTRILSQANAKPGKLPTTPGTPEDYLKAWGVEG